MQAVVEAIARAKFIATDVQVESLAALVADGKKANSTYLSVLVAHTQNELSGKRKISRSTVKGLLKVVHDRFYPCVLKGVSAEGMDAKERNKKATFARTCASDLRHYIGRGGDIRKLEPGEVRKHKLRSYGRRVPTGTRAERSFVRAESAVLRAAKKIARDNPSKARKQIKAMQSELQTFLRKLTKAPAKRKQIQKKRAAVRRYVPSQPVAQMNA